MLPSRSSSGWCLLLIRVSKAIATLLMLFPLLLVFIDFPLPTLADIPPETFHSGEARNIAREEQRSIVGVPRTVQTVEIRVSDGPEAGRTILVEHGASVRLLESQLLNPGDPVVLVRFVSDGQIQYAVTDHLRLSAIAPLLAGFAVLVLLVAGLRGLGAMAGLVVSVVVIVKFIVPQLLLGRDALVISIIGSIIIMISTTYLAHGVSLQTTVALVSTAASLIIAGLLGALAIDYTKLTGLGLEEADTLRLGATSVINLRGLLLGGLLIGTLGALNDVTTTQASTVFEFAADRAAGMRRLLSVGFAVGREHIASLVNTLALAYAGSAIAIFILLTLNPSKQPLWVMLNSELVASEVVRTIAGSAGLILAVPVSTILSALVAIRFRPPEHSAGHVGHHHH